MGTIKQLITELLTCEDDLPVMLYAYCGNNQEWRGYVMIECDEEGRDVVVLK